MEKICEAKALLELKLASSVGDHKKRLLFFFKKKKHEQKEDQREHWSVTWGVWSLFKQGHRTKLMSLWDLSTIFQQSCKSGEVPVDWKLANAVPIFKKGKMILVIISLSVLLQCLVKLWRKILWKLLKNTWRTVQSLVTANVSSWEGSPV